MPESIPLITVSVAPTQVPAWPAGTATQDEGCHHLAARLEQGLRRAGAGADALMWWGDLHALDARLAPLPADDADGPKPRSA
jgi:hypothetical protein